MINKHQTYLLKSKNKNIFIKKESVFVKIATLLSAGYLAFVIFESFIG